MGMPDPVDATTALLGASDYSNYSASSTSEAPRERGIPLGVKVLFFLLLALILPVICSHWVDAVDMLYAMENYVEADGLWGGVATCLFLVLWALFLLPTSIFEMAVGYSFGFHRALVITWAGKTVGGILAFALGRTLMRDWTASVLQAHPLSRALKTAINDKMLTVVFLVRAAYIPMAVKNYGLSVCPGVSLLTFSLVSSVVNVPYSMMWSWWGSELQAEDGISHMSQQTFSVMHLSTLVIAIGASALLVILSCHWTARLYARMELEPLDQPVSPV